MSKIALIQKTGQYFRCSRLKLRMIKLFVKAMILLIIISISSGFNHSNSSTAVTASLNSSNSNGNLLIIDEVNIEAKVKNRFVPLDKLISETPTIISETEVQNPLPQILNNTSFRFNASYSTVIGHSQSLVIHHFALDIYRVISGEKHELNQTSLLSLYYDPNDPQSNLMEFVLEPNSSKSEALIFPSLELISYGIYKFVFRVQYHVYQGASSPVESYYNRNITFELIESYPTPPYIILYAFYIVLFIFVALIVFGKYGDRKYQQPA